MENSQVPNRPELVLNTRNTCFLCLRKLTPAITPKDKETGIFQKNLSLKLLCKYLKVSPQYFLHGGNERVPSDFRATLCSPCASLVDTLENLVKQQEILARLIEHHVRVLDQVMGEPEETPSLWTTLQAKLEGGTARLVEQLRNETRRKCSIKKAEVEKICFPKLDIPRLDSAFPSSPSVESSSENMETASESGMLIDPVPPASELEILIDPVSPATESGTLITSPHQTKSPPEELLETLMDTYCFKVSEDQYEWSCCNKLLTSRPPNHLTSMHPELFLGHLKQFHVSEQGFAVCCQKILREEAVKCIQQNPVKRSGNDDNWSRACSFCGAVLRDGSYHKHHLILKHQQDLAPEFMKLQQNIAESNDVNVTDTNVPASKRTFTCDWDSGGCGQVFKQKCQLNRHNQLARKNVKIWTCEVPHGGSLCKLEFPSSCALHRHMKEVKLPGGMEAESTKEDNEQDDFLKKRKWRKLTCHQCRRGRKFLTRKELLKHVNQVHRIPQANNETQKDQVFLESLLGPSPTSPTPPPPVSKSKKRTRNGKPKKATKAVQKPQEERISVAKERDEEGRLIWDSELDEVSCWCNEPYGGRPMIQCSNCGVWNHMKCEGLGENSKPLQHFCGDCDWI